MKPFYQLLNIRALVFGPLALLVLVSCGSYQYAGYEHDGIYAPDTTVAGEYSENDQRTSEDQTAESYENTLYYQQQFSQQAQQLEPLAEGGIIFTDIDTYSSGSYGDEAYMQDDYQGAYGAWGDDPDEIAINIYNTPYHNYGYYGFYAPYYSGYYGHPYYHSYPHYYGYGYHSPWRWSGGWSIGFGTWGYGYAYQGWGYNNPYHYGYYSPRNYSRNVAYNSSRRNSYADYTSYRATVSNRSRSYTNTRDVRADSRRVSSDDDRSVYRRTSTADNDRTYSTRRTRVTTPKTVRSQSSSSRREYRATTPNVRRSSTQTRSPQQQVRRTTTQRSSSGTVRTPVQSTRSTGTRTRTSSSSGRRR